MQFWKKKKTRGITLAVFKVYHKTKKSRQCSIIEGKETYTERIAKSSEIDSHKYGQNKYGQLIFDNRAETIQ